jgi:hypothetical protein
VSNLETGEQNLWACASACSSMEADNSASTSAGSRKIQAEEFFAI